MMLRLCTRIDTPFELVKKDINDTFAGLSFDPSVLPVPEQNTVSFCSQMDTSVVDDLGHDLIKITKIGIALLVVLALLLVAANCVLEWYKWRCLKNHLRYTREAWATDPAIYHPGGQNSGTPTLQLSDHNLLMLQGNMLHPLLTKIANRISALFRLSTSKHIHLTWFFHYVFHPPALACFLIGFFGLLSVELQLLAISPLEHKYQDQAQASVQDFSNFIATSINATMFNQSATYANDINSRVDQIQSTINDGLFGWVNGTTTTLNNTINAFYTDLQDAVSTVFNGTILESPVEEFIRCFIGSKVDAIEDALTFLHNNLIIDIPRVNDTVLVLSPADVDEATQPIATAAIGGGNGNNQGVVGKLVNTYVESLKKERVMFSVFMGLWGLVVLMALAVIFWHSYGRDWMEKYKKRRWQKKQRSGIDGLVVPFRDITGVSQRTGMSTQGGDAEKGLMPVTSAPASKPGLFSKLKSTNVVESQSTLAPQSYPLNGGRPEYEKSWESILDSANASGAGIGQGSRAAPKISGPRKLLPFGNLSGKSPSAEAGESTLPWYTRLTNKFWKKEETDGEDDWPPAKDPSSTQERARPPKLAITTSNGSVRSFDADVEQPENNVPTSAWSLSPRKSTWISNLTPPKFSTLRPKSRRNASVPNDIDPADPDETFTEKFPKTSFALPIHYGLPKQSTPLATSPPPPPPPPNFQLPTYAVPTPPPPIASVRTTPPGLTHQKHQSSADPFATPFDDERYGVTIQSPSSVRNGAAFVSPVVGTAL